MKRRQEDRQRWIEARTAVARSCFALMQRSRTPPWIIFGTAFTQMIAYSRLR